MHHEVFKSTSFGVRRAYLELQRWTTFKLVKSQETAYYDKK